MLKGMKMVNKKHERLRNIGIILLMLAVVSFVFLLLLGGCESTPMGNENDTELKDKMTDIQKISTALKETIEGSNNELNTKIDNSKTTLNDILKIVKTININSSKSATTAAEQIEELHNKVTNIHNSSVLMGYIIGALVVVILLQTIFGFKIMLKVIKHKFEKKIQKVIMSDDNNLTEDIWKKYE